MSVIRLICYCPDYNCDNNRTALKWTHTSCSSPLYLDRDANIHCYIWPETYLILDSIFKYSKYKNWYKAKYTRLSQVLATIVNFDFKKVGMDKFTQDSLIKFIEDLTENLFKRTIK